MIALLVEDDRDLAANIGEFLESAGHRVDCAADGLLARRLCCENRYDAIVLDDVMPQDCSILPGCNPDHGRMTAQPNLRYVRQ